MENDMLDPKIETFLMICKYMNFTKAAEELHLRNLQYHLR